MKQAYSWGDGDLVGKLGPRTWQAKLLSDLGEHLKNPATRFQPFKAATSSGHGIGKSAEVAFLAGWAMDTCDDCKVVITANTEPQLRTKTWPEMRKWFRLTHNAPKWNVTETAIYSNKQGREGTWRIDRVTWSENNTEAFAGLHNEGKRIVLIFDEASAIADRVWEVAEGALTDENTEIIWLAFGNPTQNTGRFKECFGSLKHRWKTYQIDSREVEGTNKAQIEQWEQDYGEDSDFFRVRVRGEFPRAGSNQFIPSDIVAVCRKYEAKGYEHLPRIMGVDVARFGDDQSIIGIRQGRQFRILGKYRGLDTVQLAEKVIEEIGKEKPDAVVVDGDGIGAGVVDTLKHRGFSRVVTEFHGGASPHDPAAYYNRRAEIWGLMRDALKEGMKIPDEPELAADLEGPQYGFSSKQQIQLEKKDDMKKRGLSSPDLGDALAMTFAVKMIKRPPQKTSYGGYSGSWMG